MNMVRQHQPSGSSTELFDRMDGTFFHPAPFRTAARCIEFWSTVEIPDQVIDQFADAYHQAQIAEVDVLVAEKMDVWDQNWCAANPRSKERHLPVWEEKHQVAEASYRANVLSDVQREVNERRPMALGEYDIVQFVRAAQMWRHAPHPERFPAEEQKVGNHTMELFSGSMTVNEIQEKYDFRRFKWTLDRIIPVDSGDRIVDAVELLGNDLLALQQEVIVTRLSMEERLSQMEQLLSEPVG